MPLIAITIAAIATGSAIFTPLPFRCCRHDATAYFQYFIADIFAA